MTGEPGAAATRRKRPLVVGIAGGSASGKTTLSKRLTEELDGCRFVVYHMDDYFRAVRPHMTAPITGQDFEDHNHPDSFDLEQMVRDLTEEIARGDHELVLIEGLLTLAHAPIRELLDLGIFVDAPSDERIVRRLKRNMGFGLEFDDIARFYLDSVRFRHQEYVEPSRWHADIVLNGSYPSARGVAMIKEWILRHS